MKSLDKYIGCLLGGAAGDALGYEVEFFDEADIFSRFGNRGITEYVLKDGKAQISDDTQMTLFTATGLLLGTANGVAQGAAYIEYINYSYKDWYRTQTEAYPLSGEPHHSWLVNLPELFYRRAPGITCLSAIESAALGTIEAPINSSKGCGGIMRVAPIGLYFDGTSCTGSAADMIGAQAAALTHGHSLGYIPAAALVHIIRLIVHDNMTIFEAVKDMKNSISVQFADDKHLNEFLQLIDKAVLLAQDEQADDLEAIRALGEGWVAEETLAIAIYCCLKHSNDFEKAVVAAVNHSGDSDSTGAVTGNIVGAYLGFKEIPDKYLDSLELKDVVIDIATDLYNDCRLPADNSYCNEQWTKKYIEGSYSAYQNRQY